MQQQTCNKCGKAKEISCFNPHRKGGEKLRKVCRECTSKYMKAYMAERWASDEAFRDRVKKNASEWTKKNPEKRAAIAKRRNKRELEKYPEKVKARALVNQRVRFNRIPKASSLLCSCGQQASHYHHYKGYAFEHRYDVVPVCIKCHSRLG